MNAQERYAFTQTLKHFGGSFVAALGELYQVADAHNCARLDAAFPDIVERYGPGSYFFDRRDVADGHVS